jgi:hypothetical protein
MLAPKTDHDAGGRRLARLFPHVREISADRISGNSLCSHVASAAVCGA